MWSRNWTLFCLLFVVAFFVAVDSNNWPYSQNEKRVINGWKTSMKTFPHHVAVVHRIVQTLIDQWYLRCGGSIITSEWILTAAHCLRDDENTKNKTNIILTPWWIRVAVGQSYSEYYWQYVYGYFEEVTQVVAHPGYDGFANNDIALLRLKNKLTWCETVKPVNLPYRHQEMSGDELYIVGFGVHKFNHPRDYPLRAGRMNIIDCSICDKTRECKYAKDGSQICLTHEKYVPCFGDSGGGAVHDLGNSKYILVGVISLAPRNCSVGKYSPTVRVKHYLRWIEEYLYEPL